MNVRKYNVYGIPVIYLWGNWTKMQEILKERKYEPARVGHIFAARSVVDYRHPLWKIGSYVGLTFHYAPRQPIILDKSAVSGIRAPRKSNKLLMSHQQGDSFSLSTKKYLLLKNTARAQESLPLEQRTLLAIPRTEETIFDKSKVALFLAEDLSIEDAYFRRLKEKDISALNFYFVNESNVGTQSTSSILCGLDHDDSMISSLDGWMNCNGWVCGVPQDIHLMDFIDAAKKQGVTPEHFISNSVSTTDQVILLERYKRESAIEISSGEQEFFGEDEIDSAIRFAKSSGQTDSNVLLKIIKERLTGSRNKR